MFTIDINITDLKIKERNLYKVFFSMNIHQVATPELTAEDAKSYVFFFREGGKYQSYVGLHFLRTDRKMYYRYSSNPFPESELQAVEEEARSFAEDMGAMLDELGLAKMSDMEKDRWIDEQDIFSSKKKTDEQAAAAVAAQPPQAEQATPVVQPAPAAQPVPAPAPVQPAPVPQPEPAAQSMPEPGPAPAGHARVQTTVQSPAPSRPQKKQGAAQLPKAAAPVSDPQAAVDDVMEQAVKAGIVKAPKQPLKKDIRSSTGVASRDKDALARLLASF